MSEGEGNNGIIVVHPEQLEVDAVSGAMVRLGGVSRNLTGAQGIHMGLSTIPPDCSSTPHRHTNCESAIYVVSGHGKMLMGPGLEQSQDFGPGDFIYVPAYALHQPVNTGSNEPVVLVIARNSPVEVVEEYSGSAAGQPHG